MPVIGQHHPATSFSSYSAVFDGNSVLFGVVSIVMLASVVSICTCCGKKPKKREDEEVYGVYSNPVVPPTAPGDSPTNRTINFRSLTKAARLHDRHSQPVGPKRGTMSARASAPLPTGRALPQLPADLYTPIDKTRKADDISFVDDSFNRMYECIDVETDSFADPLYSKVGETRPAPNRERRYDYPVFSGRVQPVTARPRESTDENLYQSASQIYAAGSEDPYSSINSEPSRAPVADIDGDTSSAYDPGYAKVQPTAQKPQKSREKLEKTERELDLLYSKIRRNNKEDEVDFASRPGPSSFRPPVVAEIPLPLPIVEPIVRNAFDEQSVSSREPSYRYITMRENADIVRERLRQQGRLGPPIREHYYSTIGNEYEVVDANSGVQPVRPTGLPAPLVEERIPPTTALNITLPDVAPPPPTSPIPDQVPANISIQSRSREDVRRSPNPIEHTLNGNAMYAVVSKTHKKYGNENGSRPVSGLQPEIHYPILNHSPRMSGRVPEKLFNNNNDALYTSLSRGGGSGSGIHPGSQVQTTFPASPTPFGVRSTYGDTAKHIQEFMRRPTLPYNSMDTLLGRRTVEERERIVEKRASITSGVGINIDSNSQSGQMSKSLDASNGSWRQADGRNLPHDDRIYQVEIQRVPASGRSAFDRIPTPEIPPPPPTSEIPPVTSPSNKSFVLNIKPTDSGRSETQKNNQATRSKTNVDLNESGGSTSSRTSARKSKPWKEESEEEKKRRLGTIYTGKDYVSPIDFSDQRPWPMVSGSETEEAKNKKN